MRCASVGESGTCARAHAHPGTQILVLVMVLYLVLDPEMYPVCSLRLTLRDKPPNLGTAAIKLYLGLTSSDHHTRWQPHSPRDPRTASPGYVWASQQPRPPRLRVPYLWLLELKSWFSTPQRSARTTNGINLCRGRHPLKLRTFETRIYDTGHKGPNDR